MIFWHSPARGRHRWPLVQRTIQHGTQMHPRTAKSAFRRSNRNPQHAGRDIIRMARNTHQRHDIALLRGQLRKGMQERAHRQPPVMFWHRHQSSSINTIQVRDFASLLAKPRIKRVSQNGEQPSPQIAAALKLINAGISFDNRILHQILCRMKVARKSKRIAVQSWKLSQNLLVPQGKSWRPWQLFHC